MMKSAGCAVCPFECVKLLIMPFRWKTHTAPLRASQSLCVALWVCVYKCDRKPTLTSALQLRRASADCTGEMETTDLSLFEYLVASDSLFYTLINYPIYQCVCVYRCQCYNDSQCWYASTRLLRKQTFTFSFGSETNPSCSNIYTFTLGNLHIRSLLCVCVYVLASCSKNSAVLLPTVWMSWQRNVGHAPAAICSTKPARNLLF